MTTITVNTDDSFEEWRTKTNQISQSIANVTAINSSITAANDVVTISTASTERFRIDPSGNIGESIVPSGWATANRAFQMPAGSVYSLSTTTQGVAQNAYLSGTGWKYVVTGYASRYEQFNGTHTWYSAVSGTADANTSFSQKMTLDANGNVGIGATPDSWGTPFSGVIQGQNGTFFASRAATSDLSIGTNMYYNGTAWVYKTSDFASYYRQAGGTHYWFTAASGTAGSVATQVERLRLDANGNLGIGITPAQKLHVLGGIRQQNVTDGTDTIKFLNAAGGTLGDIYGFGTSYFTVQTGANIPLILNSTGASGALRLQTNGTDAMRIDASGNVLVTAGGGLGYGTGSGGTVTQVTSKSTPVTLNKASGQITTNNAALSSNTVVAFPLSNTAIAATDTVYINLKSGNATAGTYQVWAEGITTNACAICIRNISAGSLSEALTLNFSVIKGSAS